MYRREAEEGMALVNLLDAPNPVDKILFMGIPYRRAVFENGSHVSTKDLFWEWLDSLLWKNKVSFWWLWQTFWLLTCLSKRREESIKIPKFESYRSSSVRGCWFGTRTNLNFFCRRPMRKADTFQEQVAIAICRSIPTSYEASFVTELGTDYKVSHHQQRAYR